MHRRNNPVAMFKPQVLENVFFAMFAHVNTAPSEEVFLVDISFLRAKREKKIKAMERDVIFFPPDF